MQKMQKAGFLVFGLTFMVIGLLFLIVGYAAPSPTLKIMGAVWLPLGIIHFLFVTYFIRKEK
ncbi:MAG TPA: hypothetical protein PKN36_03160 [bacterium]|nr:hypothetical protein [bacterium]